MPNPSDTTRQEDKESPAISQPAKANIKEGNRLPAVNSPRKDNITEATVFTHQQSREEKPEGERT